VHGILATGLVAMALAAPALRGQEGAELVLKPGECRIRAKGNIRDDGSFSFWDEGLLGDWFLRAGARDVTVAVLAWGKTIAGEPPTAAVDLIALDGGAREIGRIPIASSQERLHELTFPVPDGFFGVQLRHTNRRAGEGPDNLRHLVVNEIRIQGARRASGGPAECAFFGAARAPLAIPRRTLETSNLLLHVDPERGTWSLRHKPSGCALTDAGPAIHIRDLPVDLEQYELGHDVHEGVEHELGAFTQVKLSYTKAGELKIEYHLLLSTDGDELIARLSFANETGRELVVGRASPVVAGGMKLGGRVDEWTVIGDAKSNAHPYETVQGADLGEFESWWYAAAKNLATGRSVLFGSLTNDKGLGRFLVLPGSDASLRAAAYSDYEGCVMPPGARIEGEWMLVHFGERGTDSLERFGDLIARAHGIDLMEQHPIDPYNRDRLSLFGTWNGYGSSVVKGFEYKHDRTKGNRAYMDPAWTRANRQKLRDLGLQHFGYAQTGPVNVQGAGTPLVRRYGNPDFWFKAAQQIHDEHPEYYVNERIDFSNPDVLAFERERVRKAFAGKTGIVRYGWDFTNDWKKLPGQHDPFMTSAETYRTAVGLWRDAGRRHPAGAYALVWMNVPGLNYDRLDVIHIGHDSDTGYGGPGLTFTHGLTRQISGRYFLNGRVWWNSPDSFHVYVGGLYSYNQGKVHASYCSLSGNLVHLGEPLTDEDIPEDRLDIIRRVAPTTPDVARAVDVFEHNPARLWDMAVQRPFGEWHVVGLFNVDYDQKGTPITQEIRFEDLDLSLEREYLVYEFWSQRLLGALKGGFTRTLQAPDCEVYSIVAKQAHPVLISTSRHVRQMAYDIMDLKWEDATRTLSGVSRVVQDDPYELRVFLPEGYALAEAQAAHLTVETKTDEPLLLARFTSPASQDVAWRIRFAPSR
jgi:hypothetical protein